MKKLLLLLVLIQSSIYAQPMNNPPKNEIVVNGLKGSYYHKSKMFDYEVIRNSPNGDQNDLILCLSPLAFATNYDNPKSLNFYGKIVKQIKNKFSVEFGGSFAWQDRRDVTTRDEYSGLISYSGLPVSGLKPRRLIYLKGRYFFYNKEKFSNHEFYIDDVTDLSIVGKAAIKYGLNLELEYLHEQFWLRDENFHRNLLTNEISPTYEEYSPHLSMKKTYVLKVGILKCKEKDMIAKITRPKKRRKLGTKSVKSGDVSTAIFEVNSLIGISSSLEDYQKEVTGYASPVVFSLDDVNKFQPFGIELKGILETYGKSWLGLGIELSGGFYPSYHSDGGSNLFGRIRLYMIISDLK